MLQSVAALASHCVMASAPARVIAAGKQCHCDPGGHEKPCCKQIVSKSCASQLKDGKAKSGCECEMRGSGIPATPASVLPPLPVQSIAILTAPIVLQPQISSLAEPAVYGPDPGPPVPIDQAPDLGRAPPVA